VTLIIDEWELGSGWIAFEHGDIISFIAWGHSTKELSNPILSLSMKFESYRDSLRGKDMLPKKLRKLSIVINIEIIETEH